MKIQWNRIHECYYEATISDAIVGYCSYYNPILGQVTGKLARRLPFKVDGAIVIGSAANSQRWMKPSIRWKSCSVKWLLCITRVNSLTLKM